jgi:hypothetical protein
MNRLFIGMVAVAALGVVGCRTTRESHYKSEPQPAPPIRPTVLQYVDSDAFDALFEVSLINQDPLIIVRTDSEKPDWDGRLTAWIAAWNLGNKADRPVIRSQIPLPTQVDAEFLREFRLLVFGAVDRAEEAAKTGSAWWREERTRSRRVALLRPYNLRFHVCEDMKIQLILFHGEGAAKYRETMTALTGAEARDWSRTLECSMSCKPPEASRIQATPTSRPILEFSER